MAGEIPFYILLKHATGWKATLFALLTHDQSLKAYSIEKMVTENTSKARGRP
jgi:hypothetical protein